MHRLHLSEIVGEEGCAHQLQEHPSWEGLEAGEELGSDQEGWEGQRQEGSVGACVHHRQPLERWQHTAWLMCATCTSRCGGLICSTVSRNTQEKSPVSSIEPGMQARS
jgi:hypothetical protein